MDKSALITGVTGQDGSYLAEFLLDRGYEVHGIRRRGSTSNTWRIDHLLEDSDEASDRFRVHHGDMVDSSNLSRLIEKIEPDEVYNLAAQSNVAVSFVQPEYTADVNALGTLRLLDALRESRVETKLYQASTSEMFGTQQEGPLDEQSSFRPRSPYGVAKLYAYWITRNYRESYDLFTSNGILFNHESPRRGEEFVTRKITRGVARIESGLQETIFLGNLDAERDWGYAPEYVEAMWMMLQQDEPDDYVIATGETHTVREFATRAFQITGREIEWEGEGENERAIDRENGQVVVEVDSEFLRPSDIDTLRGNSEKAHEELGWTPETSFHDLVEIMVEADIDRLNE